MRTIIRNPNPPSCLANQPSNQSWEVFMETPCHRDVSDSLHAEQHFLCCYCESSVGGPDGHIEHMAPRKASPTATYRYDNLAISCNGGSIEHCGHFKDNSHKNPFHSYDPAVFSRPHDAETVRFFRYLPNGDIVPSEGLSPAERDRAEYMIGYLGLASSRLQSRRRSHARTIIDTLGSNPDEALLDWARNYFLEIGDDSQLREFHSLSRGLLEP